jgi:hypothetical protein
MRWYIIRTLLWKEILRNLANRGGIALALLLVVAALLLSVFGRDQTAGGGLIGGVQRCYIDYVEDGPWVQHLRKNVPPELADQLRFRSFDQTPRDSAGNIVYRQNTGAIQIRPAEPGRSGYLIESWHHGTDGSALAPFEAWFWKETRRFYAQQAAAALERSSPGASNGLAALDPQDNPLWQWKEAHRYFQNEVAVRAGRIGAADGLAGMIPDIDARRRQLEGGAVDMRSSIAAALVVFALFFACIYTLPSLTCEERERGILLAQALSPASPLEILASKFLFYPALGIGLAVLLSGIYNPAVLRQPFYWLAVGFSTAGFLGVGMTVASLARTQREASMGALCYLLAVTLILFICQQTRVPLLPYLALEFHGPRILQAALGQSVTREHWGHLGGAAALAIGWLGLATYLFRRRGWQ